MRCAMGYLFRLFGFLYVLGVGQLMAQRDTLFWFVAPEAAQNHGDRPIVLRLATGTSGASIRVDQPANPLFPMQVVNIGAQSAFTLDLTPWINMVENKPGNTILNYGIRIRASQPVMAYYEINPTCNCNPDIFTLKGGNALGNQFVLPFQNFLNSASYARPAFDIVATENNTQVTITPSVALVGRPAGTPFTITLNRGQTWSGVGVSTAAAQRPSGTIITSTHPIAVTITDDSMMGTPYGGCVDIMGDQLVPIQHIGDEYAAIKGYLNGPDRIYVLATQPATTVQIDGMTVATLNAGQTYGHSLTNPVAYIRTSSPAYVLHTSGFGCEVGGAVLPTLRCTGSNTVTFVRSTNEFFALNILVQNGGQGNFVLNGNPAAVTPAAFQPVPGTNGAWLYAQINLSGTVPVLAASTLSNSTHLFHLGIIHGGASTGCRYGYFSDFASFRFDIQTPSDTLCEGQALQLQTAPIPGASYQWTGPANFSAQTASVSIQPGAPMHSGTYIVSGQVGNCPVVSDTVLMHVVPTPPAPILQSNAPVCVGDTLMLSSVIPLGMTLTWTLPNQNVLSSPSLSFPSVQMAQAGTYQAFLQQQQCPGPPTSIPVMIHPNYAMSAQAQICQGDSIWLQSQWRKTAGTYTDALLAVTGCDSLIQTQLSILPVFQTQRQDTICRGQTFTLPNLQTVLVAGNYPVSLTAQNGCDSLVSTFLHVADTFYTQWSATICQGDSVLLPSGQYQQQAGTFYFPLQTQAGCDSTVQVDIILNPTYAFSPIDTICQGQNFVLPDGNVVQTAGVFPALLSTQQGCDSLITTQLWVMPTFAIQQSFNLCSGQPFLLPDGQTVQQPGTYTVVLPSMYGCDSTLSISLQAVPSHQVLLQASTCANQPFVLPDGSLTQVAGVYSYTYQTYWGCDSVVQLQLSILPIHQTQQTLHTCWGQPVVLPNGLSVQNPGQYTSILQASTGCDSLVQSQVTVHLPDTVQQQLLGCEGTPQWVAGAWRETAGIYQESLLNGWGCDSSVFTQLAFYPIPSDFMPPDTGTCGRVILLQAAYGYQAYEWSTGATQSQISTDVPGTYLLSVTNQAGCVGLDSVVVKNTCLPAIYVPNAFTPNGDGLNDMFFAQGVRIDRFKLSIFDRWGMLLFTSDDIQKGWDGTHLNVPLPQGVYVYHIEYTVEPGLLFFPEPILGQVNLIR
jgi:gliding motility-associated-like protein